MCSGLIDNYMSPSDVLSCLFLTQKAQYLITACYWGEPHTSKILLDRHFTSINDKKRTSNLTMSCVIRKFLVVSEIYHIWSLDHQCHGTRVAMFSGIAIHGRWIVGVTEHV